MKIAYLVKQTVPPEILAAGDWKAEQLGISRKEVFRSHDTFDLVKEHKEWLQAQEG